MTIALAITLVLIILLGGAYLFHEWYTDSLGYDDSGKTWCPVCKRLTCCGAICWEHGVEKEEEQR